MPPSGYNRVQAEFLSQFLLDCSRALEEEAFAEGSSLVAAIDGEIANIAAHLTKRGVSSAQTGVLVLTKEFYLLLKRQAPSSPKQFRAAAVFASEQISSEITRLKVARVGVA